MSRARTIKPGFFTNDSLGEMNPLGRLLFAGLWTLADRDGRLLDRPKKIKAEVLPYDSFNVDKGLCELADRGFIQRYTVDGVACIQVLHWLVHQRPHPRELPSELPAVPVSHVHASAIYDSSVAHASVMHGSSMDDAYAMHEPDMDQPRKPNPDPVPASRADASSSFPSFPSLPSLPPSPPSGEERPAVPKPKRERVPITESDTEDLIAKYGAQYGSPQSVRDEIDLALNHQARFKNFNERLYVDGWLRRELTHRPGLRMVNGHTAPPRRVIDKTGMEN